VDDGARARRIWIIEFIDARPVHEGVSRCTFASNQPGTDKMNNIFLIKIKNVYGNRMIYPVNDLALSFSRLMGKKTFNKGEIDIIKDIGFEVQVEQQSL
jgi:hypothetical protein